MFDKKEFKDNFEFYIGAIFMLIATLLTIVNTFTRYFSKFSRIAPTNFIYKAAASFGHFLSSMSIMWMEDIIKLCFIWVVFMGAAGSLRKGTLMGVDIFMQIAHGKTKKIIGIIRAVFLFLCSSAMLYTVIMYFMNSTKTTDSLEISYNYANISVVICFLLMTIYAVVFFIRDLHGVVKEPDTKDISKKEV